MSGLAPNRAPLRRIRIVLADGQAAFRERFRRLLERERDLAVVGEASDSRELLALASRLHPDIILLDLSIAGGPAFDVLRDLSALDASMRPVLLTAEIPRDQIIKVLQCGARGVLLKSSAADLILRGLRTVMQGQHWVDRQTVTDLLDTLRELSSSSTPSATFGLTARQLQIVAAVVAGSTNRDIAGRLGISEDTVKHHLTQIFDKTNTSNRLELALFAMHHNLGKAD